MNPSKDLFAESCEGGNILGNLVNTMMNANNPHPFMNLPENDFEDLWELGMANEGYQEYEQQWQNPLIPEEIYEEQWKNAAKDEEFEQAWVNQNLEHGSVKDTAASMLNVLNAQTDPKFQNSEFYKFLQNLHTGRMKIENGTVVEDFGDVWNAEKPEETQSELWNGLTPDEKQRFEEVWHKSQETEEEKMLREWGEQWEKEKNPEFYEFCPNNPFVYVPNPYELAVEYLNSESYNEGILLLEVELQRNKENSSAWLLLGKTLSDLDIETKAVLCFKEGLSHDPYNTELLLSAATASVNMFDHSPLVHYFSMWLLYNADYCEIKIPNNPSLEDLKEAYTLASEINPQDSYVYLCLGIIGFALNNFYEAEYYFNLAVGLRPLDYDLCNKLGVAVMKQGRIEEANNYFKHCLDLKPGFIKAWTNMGHNHAADHCNYKKAIECYLSGAAVYYSDHLFEFIRSALIMIDRNDLVHRLDTKDPLAFTDEFQITISNHTTGP